MGIEFVTDNDLYFKSLWKRIDFAEKSIWLVTYNLGNDLISSITMKKLVEAQKRGVNVCVMVDDMNSHAKHQHQKALKAVGGQYHTLNHMMSVSKFFSGEFFSRHHEKLYLIDDIVSTGSQNVNSEYGGIKYGCSMFKDLNLDITGHTSCVSQIRTYFHSLADKYSLSLHPVLSNQQLKDSYVDQSTDEQDNSENMQVHVKFRQENTQLTDQLIKMIDSSEKEVILLQPYYYTVKKMENAISKALARGVDVKMITTQKRDQDCYKNVKNEYIFKDLMQQGMNVYEYRHQVLHMKGYMSDGQHLSIGSMNQDRWSWYINNELNIAFTSPLFYSSLSSFLDNKLLPNCYKVNPSETLSYPKRFQFFFWDKVMRLTERLVKQNAT